MKYNKRKKRSLTLVNKISGLQFMIYFVCEGLTREQYIFFGTVINYPNKS